MTNQETSEAKTGGHWSSPWSGTIMGHSAGLWCDWCPQCTDDRVAVETLKELAR